jgi:hypothetical protein
MAEEKKGANGFHARTALTIIGIIGGPLLVWGDVQMERGSTKEKIAHIERRQEEDRKNTRQDINEVKEHVKLIDQTTQTILQEIRAMQAVQRAERRERSQ